MKTESVEMRPGLALMAYNRAYGYKGKGDDLKEAKRLVRAIQSIENFEHDMDLGTLGFKDQEGEPVFVPMKKKTRIWFWDLVKGDLKNDHSIAEEETLRAVAKCLGKLEEFEALIEDSEPEDEDADTEGDNS